MTSAKPKYDAEWVRWQDRKFRLARHFWRDVFYKYIFAGLLWKIEAEGLENIPASGPAVIMTNHSTLIDGLIPMGEVKSRFVIPMVKEETLQHPIFKIPVRQWGSIGVKRGEVDRQALQKLIQLLKSDELVMILPEGTRTTALQKPKDGLTYIALKAETTIVPTGIWGLENFGDDLFTPWRRTKGYVRFGKPFKLKTGGRTRVPRDEMSLMTQEMMYQLAAVLPEHKRGDYADLSKQTTEYLEFV